MKLAVANMFKGKTMEVIGGIGSGKSTLCEMIAKLLREYGVEVVHYPEHIVQPLFGKMLKDPKEYAFVYQNVMLHKRISTHEASMLHHMNNPDAFIIYDSGLIVDYTFEQYHHIHQNITDLGDEIYRETVKLNSSVLTPPDVVLKLKCETTSAKKRIIKRDRCGENVYTIKYLDELNQITNDLLNEPKFTNLKNSVYEWDNNSHATSPVGPACNHTEDVIPFEHQTRNKMHLELPMIAEKFFQPKILNAILI